MADSDPNAVFRVRFQPDLHHRRLFQANGITPPPPVPFSGSFARHRQPQFIQAAGIPHPRKFAPLGAVAPPSSGGGGSDSGPAEGIFRRNWWPYSYRHRLFQQDGIAPPPAVVRPYHREYTQQTTRWGYELYPRRKFAYGTVTPPVAATRAFHRRTQWSFNQPAMLHHPRAFAPSSGRRYLPFTYILLAGI